MVLTILVWEHLAEHGRVLVITINMDPIQNRLEIRIREDGVNTVIAVPEPCVQIYDDRPLPPIYAWATAIGAAVQEHLEQGHIDDAQAVRIQQACRDHLVDATHGRYMSPPPPAPKPKKNQALIDKIQSAHEKLSTSTARRDPAVLTAYNELEKLMKDLDGD